MSPTRTFGVIVASISIALGLLLITGAAFAQNKDGLDKIADAIEKGNLVAAKKLAEDYAKKFDSNEELMNAFAKVKGDGLGVGGKGGIEMEIRDLAKNGIAAADLKARAKDLVRMTDHTTSVAYVSERFGITKEVKKGMPYTKLAMDLVAAADDLKKAINAQNPAAVQKAANKVDQACIVCHSIYRGKGN